jgi:1,4-alpha-glucan branching enzyme
MSETPIRRASPAAATRLAPQSAIPAIDAGERAALLEGRHANPHQVLGAHAAQVGGVTGAVVRVL